MATTSIQTKFELGQIVGTPRAMRELNKADRAPWEYIVSKHGQGDWGDMGAEDAALNDLALSDNDGRVMSAYTLPTGVKVWVITEADRSATTILLPEEY